jgi:hypothetical protein
MILEKLFQVIEVICAGQWLFVNNFLSLKDFAIMNELLTWVYVNYSGLSRRRQKGRTWQILT